MKFEAYGCKHCNNFYHTKKAMEKCRRDCASRKRIQARAEAVKKEGERLANQMRFEVEWVSEIPEWITEAVRKRLDREVTFENWDLKFYTDLAPTHDAPVGKKTEFSKPTSRYAGWRGRVTGTTTIYKNPVKFSGGPFGEIRGFSDLFDRHRSSFIKGVNTGSGSGGERFSYEVRLYLDDFPKIKAKYDKWKALDDQKKVLNSRRKELIEQAKINLVEKNKDVCDLKDVAHILNARLRQVENLRRETEKNILASQEFKNATKVPGEEEFDHEIHNELNWMFS